SAGIAGWVEMLLLRSKLNARIGRTGLPTAYLAQLWAAAAAAALGPWGVQIALPGSHPLVTAPPVLRSCRFIFFVVTFVVRIPEASRTIRRLGSRFRP